MSAAIQVLVALMIADFLWHGASRWIDRRVGDAVAGPDESTRATRIATLLPLFRKVLAVVLVITVALIALSAVGVEIAPLLGAAGIVGIAVGFGAQTLVKDIITGVFFLIEDAFRVGEYVEIDNTRGTVEAISLRSLRLRHHRGPLHTLPFGEIRSLTNHSRDWVIVKIEFPFALDVDPVKVKKTVRAVAAEIAADSELGKDLLDAPKSQGIRRLENYSAIIGVKFMARPGEQFVLRREIYHRLLKAFDAAGLKLSTREIAFVHAPDGSDQPTQAPVAAKATDAKPGPVAAD
jgi:small-conductance mechanosensitive channel